jgi:methionine--tRNA ligase beta chain
MDTISLGDFRELDLRIGKVVSAERLPDADKLIKLILDLGDHQRQVVAGIADIVADAADLVGKEMLVLVNLEPRILRGEESNGMILAVNVGGKPVLLTPEEEVPPGSPVT